MRFVVRDGAFTVPGNRAYPLWLAAQLLFCAPFGEHTVDDWAHHEVSGFTGPVGESVSVVNSVLGALSCLVLLPLAVAGLRDRPVLSLTPAALVVRNPFGTRTYPWKALASWSAVPGQSEWILALPVVRPDLVVKRGMAWWWGSKVPLGPTDVHPSFFADAALFYVSRPDRRPEIGTLDEYDSLLSDLGVRTAA